MAEGEGNAHRKPLKFSFAKTKPPLLPKGNDPDVVVEYVSVVDAEDGVVVRCGRGIGSGVRVIPKLENTWRPEKGMRDAVMSTEGTEGMEGMEGMEVMDAGGNPNLQYGRELASKASLKEIEDEVLREDLVKRPEGPRLEVYEELPVEEFGEALLRGMGWERGKPIGRNAKTVVAPYEGVGRQGTLGLGAVAAQSKAIRGMIC